MSQTSGAISDDRIRRSALLKPNRNLMNFTFDQFNPRERIALLARQATVNFSNFHLVHYRHIDGFLVTAKNSGTHWLKYLISNALAAELGLPPPRFASGDTANDYVGNPKWPHKYPQAPRIGSSHNLPSSLLSLGPMFRLLRLPPVVVLVRDIEQAMLSHYVKWRGETGLSLSDYVHVPAPGRKTVADVWWYIDFFNRWGRLASNHPDQVLVVRYEQLRGDPTYWLETVLRHYRIRVAPSSIEAAVKASKRETMRREQDPNAGEVIIPADHERFSASFMPEDRAELHAMLSKRLRYDFGYQYCVPGGPATRAAA
jgi:hypothetical protein